MSDSLSTVVGFRIVFVVLIFFFGIYCGKNSVQESQYKQGQIDAIQGEVNYHLVDQPDGATVWMKKGGE